MEVPDAAGGVEEAVVIVCFQYQPTKDPNRGDENETVFCDIFTALWRHLSVISAIRRLFLAQSPSGPVHCH